ncbi:hypothetical protein HYH03_015356 [Edaphochlamys debaryana]|uniref:Choline transporter-like protein n=1 Tax=Edaphochlamys debaryana TaxID=47281 RepID=A0A835XJJ2_9CHLO|nr:hypothetical protein HYH03_015356 [Edaphochlamys debaryana]|eukprot:KAG2485912.1 hypothetical protein HYH03_015356 [Edaphochlamys debaryana]
MAYGHEPGPDDPGVPLISGPSLFEMKNRPRRDTGWLVAYLLVLFAAFGGGIYAFVNRNTRYSELLSPDSLLDPALCPAGASHAARRLLQAGPDAPSAFDLDLFMRAAGAWLGASVGGAVLVGLAFIALVQHSPAALVITALAMQVAIPFALGGLALAQHAALPGGLLLGLGTLTLLLWALWWPQIKLVTSLLGLAGRGVSANPVLVPTALGLQLALLGLLEAPLVLAGLAGLANGNLTYNPDRADGGAATRGDQCVDDGGQQTLCCVWQLQPWVPSLLSLVGLAATWSMFLAFQAKLFTVAGTIAQWYFHERPGQGAGTSARGPEPHGRRPPSRVLTALRFALGPSLGSLCCGAAVLTLVAMIRQALQKARKESSRNLVFACAAACLQLLLTFAEFVTRFATVRAALTGEAFMAAGRNVVALCARNAMDAFGVWWLPPLILQSCCCLMALAWGVAAWWLSYATTWARQQPPSSGPAAHHNQAAASAWFTAVFAFLAAWAVLGFLGSLLLNVVDALFVCVAMDRDQGQVSSPEVHAVVCKLPTVGALVQNPDGGLAYGAGEAGAGGYAPVPQDAASRV